MQSVFRSLKTRYKRSTLGYVWSMLSPLFMMLILTAVFSHIMKMNIENYPVFLFIGMLTWGYFDSTCQASLGVIRSNAQIIEKVKVPKFIFLVATAFCNMVDFMLSLVPLFIVMLITGHPINATVFALPLLLFPLFLFTVGVSSVLAVMNVFFEDTQHLTMVVFRALYFLCPILYSSDMLPDWLLKWVVLNPMFGLIEQIRGLFYEGIMPSALSYFLHLIGSLLVLAIGLLVFRRTDDKLIYHL